MLNKIIRYFLENRVITILILVLVVVWGISTSPFNWHGGIIPRNPIPVDAIPDIGDNQQIVATEWMGRSPKDIQDQITYPLTTSLLGIPGVKSIRSSSMFGMSFIYIIFDDNIEFYWSRSRILEKLNSLPPGTLPEGVQPALGPDATALGQIYWYTLEGRDPATGKPTGGWNAEELRTIQDYYVKYSLSAAEGVSEVASAGGFVKEYQVELNPDAMRAFNVSVMDIMGAIKKSNHDIGAETMEINKVEYLIRGLGYIKDVSDLEKAVVTVRDGVPVRISDVAFVNIGPGTRRGGLDKEGVEAVGGVVIARYGSNPLEVINNVKDKIKEMAPGLPQKTLPDGTVSKITVVPFYDRTGLIKETIGTLETSLSHEILICIIVIIVLVLNLRASVVIASMLPIAVLSTFIIMRYTGIAANIVALSGIAIAIGVMVDVGVVFVESIIRYMEMPENRGVRKGKAMVNLIYKAVSEVSGAIATAMITTIVSFLPVFAMEAQEGKMFSPLAYTKTYALASAFVLGLILLPTLSYILFSVRIDSKRIRKVLNYILIAAGVLLSVLYSNIPALGLTAVGLNNLLAHRWKKPGISNYINIGIALVVATYFLAEEWLPMGPQKGIIVNLLFVTGCIAIILALLWLLVIYYERILRWCLNNRWKFMLLPIATILCGILIWKRIGQEFMPSLNEGSFLLMPTSMPHTGIEQNLNYIEALDKRLAAIPEVETAIGKWGRVNSALDPAPAQMIQSENTFLVGYVIFDKKQGKAEVDVVKEATKVIEGKIQNGELKLTNGVSYKFAGNYEQQERATARLMIVVPLALLIVLLVLYFQFKTLTASLIHFSGVFVAFAGGFILLWLYGQDWFMNFSLAGVNMRDLFQMHTINLSVAVWVGFIALFGVATDDGVLMGTYIHHVFLEKDPQTRHAIREAVVTAGLKRVRPAAMTTATTLIALLPVLTSTGKGADIMVPMAIPTFGGMLIQSMTMFVVPVFQCWWREGLLKKEETTGQCLAQNRPVRQTARLVPVDLPVDDPRIFGRDDFPHGHHPTGTPVTELQP